jgi:putative FmdB family regulatory protein
MPLYEYECAKCNQVYEIMRKFSDAPLTECPTCQGPLKKLISLSSFALKGGGWHNVDYKKSAAPSSSKKTEAEASSSAPAADAGATATPATASTPVAASAPAAPAKDSTGGKKPA